MTNDEPIGLLLFFPSQNYCVYKLMLELGSGAFEEDNGQDAKPLIPIFEVSEIHTISPMVYGKYLYKEFKIV